MIALRGDFTGRGKIVLFGTRTRCSVDGAGAGTEFPHPIQDLRHDDSMCLAPDIADVRKSDMSGNPILVVDDSPTVLQLISTMLASGGYANVLTAADGKEAIDIATEQQPGLVLLDVILPKLNGYQVCRQLKSTPKTASIPVVMITRKSKDTDRLWGMEQGAEEYITKPFDAEELLAIVGKYVPKKAR